MIKVNYDYFNYDIYAAKQISVKTENGKSNHKHIYLLKFIRKYLCYLIMTTFHEHLRLLQCPTACLVGKKSIHAWISYKLRYGANTHTSFKSFGSDGKQSIQCSDRFTDLCRQGGERIEIREETETRTQSSHARSF